MSQAYIVSAVRANLWLILGIIGSGLLLALILTLLQTPRYTATSTIQINSPCPWFWSRNCRGVRRGIGHIR